MRISTNQERPTRYLTKAGHNRRIDALLQKNAQFISANICKTLTEKEKDLLYIRAHNKFLRPIKELDEQKYKELTATD